MAVGNAVDFAWKRYTADNGTFWSVKVDKDWGNDASSGLGAFNAADPIFPTHGRYRPRKVILQDLASGRKTARILGTVGAAAGVAGATVGTVARGAGGVLTLTSLGIQSERRPKAGTIVSKPEPNTV